MIFGTPRLGSHDVGRREVRTRFALLPRLLDDGRCVWLERVVQTRRVWMMPARHLPVFIEFPEWSPWSTYTLDQWADREQRQEVAA